MCGVFLIGAVEYTSGVLYGGDTILNVGINDVVTISAVMMKGSDHAGRHLVIHHHLLIMSLVPVGLLYCDN